MINIKYSNENNFLEIRGHANSDIKGKDLVCAGVSCIIIGLANALLNMYMPEDLIKIDNGYAKIDYRDYDFSNDKKNKSLKMMWDISLNVGFNQLLTMYESNSEYMSIEIVD